MKLWIGLALLEAFFAGVHVCAQEYGYAVAGAFIVAVCLWNARTAREDAC
jgi:hypothetical protein